MQNSARLGSGCSRGNLLQQALELGADMIRLRGQHAVVAVELFRSPSRNATAQIIGLGNAEVLDHAILGAIRDIAVAQAKLCLAEIHLCHEVDPLPVVVLMTPDPRPGLRADSFASPLSTSRTGQL